MISLFRADTFKLRKSTSYYLFFLISIIFVISMLYVSHNWSDAEFIKQGMSPGPKNAGWALSQWMSDIMLLFFSFPVSIFVASDFTNGTAKTIVAKGYSRFKIYFSKLILSFGISCSLFLVYIITAMVDGGLQYGFQSISGVLLLQILRFIGLQLLNICTLTSVWVMVAVIFRNVTLVSIINALVIMLGKFPVWIINSIRGVNLDDNMFLWIVYDIIHFRTLTPSNIWVTEMIITSLGYLIISTTLGYIFFRKADIH